MLFCQLDYPQELGTGEGYTIAEFGCALTSVASMLLNTFRIPVDPETLNEKLNSVNGYVSNGDAGVFDIIDWTAITRIFPDIKLATVERYYNPPAGSGQPANMSHIDNYLTHGYSLIVGVSFNHDPKMEFPNHFVELYRKNSDGTYQMRDPMFRGTECDTVFDTRYAVGGMSVANAILQVVYYTGPISSQSASVSPSSSESVSASPSASFSPSEEPTLIDTPVEAVKAVIPVANPIPSVKELPVSSASINTLKDIVRTLEIERNNAIAKAKIIADRYEEDFKNYTALVAAGYDTVDKVHKEVVHIKNDLLKHRKQTVEVLKSAEDMARVYAEKCKEDYSQIEIGTQAMKDKEFLQKEIEAVAIIHNAKPTFSSIATAWDNLMSRYATVRRELKALKTPQTEQIIKEVENIPQVKQLGIGDYINVLFGFSVRGGE